MAYFSYIRLNNGQKIPPIGLGTQRVSNAVSIVKKAIDDGCRLFDTAFIYFNENEIGQGIRDKINDGTVKREDIFVIDKLWFTNNNPDLVESAMKESLSKLGLDYVDLYLIHWPMACKENKIDPSLNNLEDDNDTKLEDTWKAMEKLVINGYTKSIGVSNFNSTQIKRILDIAEIKPVANEIECNVYMNQKRLIEFCKKLDIVVIGYSPFWRKTTTCYVEMPSIHEQSTINELANKYGKTTGQIVLRYLTQIGVVPIPKTETESRLKENFQIFDFQLSHEDIGIIDQLNQNIRGCPYSTMKNHKEYPFHAEF